MASVALWTLLAGPSRPARILDIVAGTVLLQVDPLPVAASRDDRGHPGAVVALLAPAAARLPIGITLPPAAVELMPVSVAGAPVSRGEITIGWGAIGLAGVRWPVLEWWNPGIPALPRPMPALAADARLGVEAAESVPGLAMLRAGDGPGAVRRLIGTEAGDAVLGGALAALAAWAPDSAARAALATAVAEALDRTTPISAALLQSAAAGFAVPELTTYLTGLSTGHPDPESALTALKARTGMAGSGSAAALGVIHQLRALPT